MISACPVTSASGCWITLKQMIAWLDSSFKVPMWGVPKKIFSGAALSLVKENFGRSYWIFWPSISFPVMRSN